MRRASGLGGSSDVEEGQESGEELEDPEDRRNEIMSRSNSLSLPAGLPVRLAVPQAHQCPVSPTNSASTTENFRRALGAGLDDDIGSYFYSSSYCCFFFYF
eukprot:s1871_g5.t1